MSRRAQRVREWMRDVDRSVTPVIGVILIVAITVVLAAVIGASTLGFTDRLGSTEVAAGDGQCIQSIGFNPNDIDSFADSATADLECVMWFDASQDNFEDGVWSDQTANEYDATSAESSLVNDPEARSNVGGTGVEGVRFDSDNKEALSTDVTTGDAGLDGRSEFTVVTVVRVNEENGGPVTTIGDISEDPFAFGPDSAVTDQWFIAEIGDFKQENTVDNWIIQTHIYDRGNSLKSYSNGNVKYDQNLVDRRVISDDPIEIGRFNWSDPNSDLYLNGTIAELIVFNKAVTNDDRKVIECGIYDKYSDVLSVDHC